MIVPDINLLLYAYDAGSALHAKAAAWWRKCLSGSEAVGLPPVVAFGFARISTNPRVFERPMTASETAGHIRSWLARPVLKLLEPRGDHVEQVLRLLQALGSAGNLVTDAQIAALAIEHGAVLHTADTDFFRFPGLRSVNPLTGKRSAGIPKR